MKVKRIISVLLVLIMILSLVNCQNVIKNTTTKESSNFTKKGWIDFATLDPDNDNDIECEEGNLASCYAVADACEDGYQLACDYIASLKKPSPTPTPSSCPQTGTPINPNQLMPPFNNVPSFGTQSFKTKSFRIKDFSSEDIIENVNFLVDRVENVKTIEYKIANFSARGETSKVAELNLELQDAILERDSVKADVINGLNDYKVGLRNHVNTLMNDPTFSFEIDNKPESLEQYKNFISSFNYEILSFSSEQNIFALIDFLSTLSLENKLLVDLINDYLAQKFSINSIPSNNLEMKNIINSLSTQITHHQNIFTNELRKIDDQIKKDNTYFEIAKNDFLSDAQEYENAANDILPILQELEQIENDPEFSTQSFRIKSGACGGTRCTATPEFVEKAGKIQEQRDKNYAQMEKNHPILVNGMKAIITPVAPELSASSAVSYYLGKWGAGKLANLLEKYYAKNGLESAIYGANKLSSGLTKIFDKSKSASNKFDKMKKKGGTFFVDNKTLKKCSRVGDAKKLLGNIKNANWNHPQKDIPKPPNWETHHIVPKGNKPPSAVQTRNLLKKNGIDIDDSYNGVNLPYEAKKGLPGDSKAIDHSKTLPREYSDNVQKRLENSIKNKGTDKTDKEALQGELENIMKDLLKGTKFW